MCSLLSLLKKHGYVVLLRRKMDMDKKAEDGCGWKCKTLRKLYLKLALRPCFYDICGSTLSLKCIQEISPGRGQIVLYL